VTPITPGANPDEINRLISLESTFDEINNQFITEESYKLIGI